MSTINIVPRRQLNDLIAGCTPGCDLGVPRLTLRGVRVGSSVVGKGYAMDEVLARSGIFQGVDPEAGAEALRERHGGHRRPQRATWSSTRASPATAFTSIMSGKN